jgi:hypothetical protein
VTLSHGERKIFILLAPLRAGPVARMQRSGMRGLKNPDSAALHPGFALSLINAQSHQVSSHDLNFIVSSWKKSFSAFNDGKI